MQWKEFRAHVRHLSVSDQDRIHDAFELGKKMHEGQLRKSGEPYFNHPIAVADMLADMGADEETIIAALLHDTVEDTSLTTEDIKVQFGEIVLTLVEGVTKLSKADLGGRPNVNEQIETLRKMFNLMQKDIRIMVIKLVDRLHNMQTTEFLPLEKQQNLARETKEVYVKIADRLCMQDLRDELEALCLNILEPDTYTKLVELRIKNENRSKKILIDMEKKIRAHFPHLNGSIDIQFEHKAWNNLQEQLQAEGAVITGLSTSTIVFICDEIETCYRSLGVLHQMWKRETLSFQDFINSPAINGYRGLHTTVILEDGTRVRCKIRTKEMHAYARDGVATICFQKDVHILHQLLPWTERISSVTQDTEGMSNEFFNTLRSDILGESITVHGPGDQTIQIPKGSTALDGAFYLFGDEALTLTSIHIGGREASLDTPLNHAASLNISISDSETVDRSWLEKTNTGFATAAIRNSLIRGKTDQEKIPIGRELLQRSLSQNKRGFIEEFNEKTFEKAIEKLGYESLAGMYIAIANGKLDPSSAYRGLFETQKTQVGNGQAHRRVITFGIPKHDINVLRRLLDIYQKYSIQLKNVRLWSPPTSNQTKFKVYVDLTENDFHDFTKDIRSSGGQNIATRMGPSELPLLILILLWGLDPVLAHTLLLGNVSIFDLTFIRFLTFFIAGILMYGLQTFFSPRTFKPLSPFQSSLLASGLALFITALFTYAALSLLSPSQYILFIIGGIVFATFFRQILQKKNWWKSAASIFITSIVILALTLVQGGSVIGIAAGISSAIGFSLYSVLSRRYQNEVGMIKERYPAFIFWISGICLLLSLPLFPFTNLNLLSTQELVSSVGFSLIFAVLPYIIFFELTRRIESRYLDATLPFVCISTILGESIIKGNLLSFIALPIALLFLIQAAYSKQTEK